MSFTVGGLQFSKLDGSVGTMFPSISNATFNAAMCPTDGVPLGSDWPG
jgi:hypothetical protein